MQNLRKTLRILGNVIIFAILLFFAALGLDMLNLHSYVAALGGALVITADACAFFVFLNYLIKRKPTP